ncbi:MAG: RNA polymerase sigma factor [Spirochaetota bacterium]
MINDQSPDENVVEAVLTGDRDAFGIIVDRYKDRLYSIGYRFFYNADDSNDFCQEVLIRVYEKLDTYSFHAPFRYWIGKIAYNHGINKKKRKGNRFDTHESIETESGERLHEPVEKEEIISLLTKAVNSLPSEYRICIDLYYFWGMPFRNISAITDFPVNTIKSYVHRARSLLRDSLRGTIAEEYHDL